MIYYKSECVTFYIKKIECETCYITNQNVKHVMLQVNHVSYCKTCYILQLECETCYTANQNCIEKMCGHEQ